MFSTAWKIAVFIWPFLKELILGERTVKEAVKSNKTRVLTIGVIFLSLALNFFSLPRLVSITSQHLDLLKKHQRLQADFNELKTKKPVVVPHATEPVPFRVPVKELTPKPAAIKQSKPAVPTKPAAQPHSKPDDEEAERRRKIRERMEQIQLKEDASRLDEALRKEAKESKK